MMEVIIVLAIGGLLFWLLYGRGNQQPPATEAEIARMVPGQAINPFWWLKYGLTFFAIFAATSWAGGISLLVAAMACLLIFWNDRSSW